MAFEQHEYNPLSVLEAEAIGEPGQRRFRLIAGIAGDVVVLWMEKEQLQALGLAIENVIEQIDANELLETTVKAEPARLMEPVPPTAPEYQISKMAIGYDEQSEMVAIFAHHIEQSEEEEPTFSGTASLSAARALAEQISETVNAGRPRCPRCGELIGPEGHVCPHNNGHLPWE